MPYLNPGLPQRKPGGRTILPLFVYQVFIFTHRGVTLGWSGLCIVYRSNGGK
jgi:hypothetical protein